MLHVLLAGYAAGAMAATALLHRDKEMWADLTWLGRAAFILGWPAVAALMAFGLFTGWLTYDESH